MSKSRNGGSFNRAYVGTFYLCFFYVVRAGFWICAIAAVRWYPAGRLFGGDSFPDREVSNIAVEVDIVQTPRGIRLDPRCRKMLSCRPTPKTARASKAL